MQFVRRPYLAAPGDVERGVRDNPVEPCTKSLFNIEPVKGLVDADKRFLHRILGVFMHRDDRPRNRVGPFLVHPDQLRERPLVPALCGDD